MYAFDIGNKEIVEHVEHIFNQAKLKNKKKEYAYKLYNGVMDNLGGIDKTLMSHIDKKLHKKVGFVERAVLRMSTYELLYEKLETSICINEAVDITKDLCGEKSGYFVNGVLDSVAKSLRGDV